MEKHIKKTLDNNYKQISTAMYPASEMYKAINKTDIFTKYENSNRIELLAYEWAQEQGLLVNMENF